MIVEQTLREYSDVWDDKESLAVLMYGSPIPSDRVRARVKNYVWDRSKQQLLTAPPDSRIVPGKSIRLKIAKAAHEALGHRGYRSVSDALRLQYTWKGMREDVQQVVSSCKHCQSQLTLKTVRDPVLHSIQPCKIFTQWVIDLIGPMPETPTGNKYIAVAVESYSRTVVATAITDKTSDTVTTWFEREIVYRYGKPTEVRGDRGGEWRKHFQDYCDRLGIKITRGSPYHPTTQGLVERCNGSLKRSILKYASNDITSWDRHVHRAVFAANACKQASTKYSPFYLLYGIDPTLPVELHNEEIELDMGACEDDMVSSDLGHRINCMNTAHVEAMRNLATAQSKQQKDYAARVANDNQIVPSTTLQPGMLVYKIVRRTAKGIRTEGPYRIHMIEGTSAVLLDGDGEKFSCNINSLNLEHVPVTKKRKPVEDGATRSPS